MAQRWRIRPYDPDRIAQLERAANIPTVVAQLLLCRGIECADDANRFLDSKLSGLHDPTDLPGAKQAAERLAAAVREQKKIVVYGDYDADGMTATAILMKCLQAVGAQPHYFVPNRLDEGYGLNDEAIRQLASQGAQVIVTVDCGIASIQEADTARQLGLELIVTDHHELADKLPDAEALVHPRLPGHSYPFPGLAGAGVAFKVAWALCQEMDNSDRVSERLKNFLLQAVGLASIGTIADVVPLVDENRILVRHGLNCLKHNPTLGLSKLMAITELHQKENLESEDVAFTLAPRLNAAGRLGQAQLGVELLTTDSEQRAVALAEYLHELNNSRTSLERSVYLAANKQAQQQFDPENDPAFVLADHGWHAGVIGIVAGRLAEKFHRPVVLISLDKLGVKPGIGSARSIPGFPLHEAFMACTDHLLGHGGHAAAAGLQIHEDNLEAFRDAFCEYAAAEISENQRTPELEIDAEVPLSALTMKTVSQIEQLSPFGHGNRRPTLCTSGVMLAEPPKRMGGGGRHVSMTLKQDNLRIRAIAFGKGDWADELASVEGPLAIAFQPVINRFRGRASVELQLTDWHISQEASLLEST